MSSFCYFAPFLRGVLVLERIENQIHQLMTFALSIELTETLRLSNKRIDQALKPSVCMTWLAARPKCDIDECRCSASAQKLVIFQLLCAI